MPILSEKPAVQFTCQSCKWSIVRPAFTHGDCLTPFDFVWLRGVDHCPKCGGTDIVESEPSISKRMNPLKNEAEWSKYLDQTSVQCQDSLLPLSPLLRWLSRHLLHQRW